MISKTNHPIFSPTPTGKRYLHWLIAGVVFCNLITGYSLFYSLRQQRLDAEERASLAAQNLVQAIGQSIEFSAQKLDDSLRSTVFALERQLHHSQQINPREIEQLLEEQGGFHIETRPWLITDATGKVIFREGSTTPPPLSLADNDMFRQLRQGQHASTRLDDITDTMDDTPERVVLSARRYLRPDGSFAGVAVAPVPLSYFQRFLKDFRLPAGSWLGITTDNNVLLALHSTGGLRVSRIPIGQPLAVSPEYEHLRAASIPAATYHTSSPLDGVSRLYSYQRVSQTPLVITVGQADDYYLQSWYSMLRFRLAIFATLLLVSFVLSAILVLFWRRQVRHADVLRENNSQLLALLKVGGVGLCNLDYMTDTWYSSPEMETIFGIDAAYPHTREGWSRLIHPEDLKSLHNAVALNMRARSTDFDYEYRIIRPLDGRIRWVQICGQYEYLPDRTLARMYGAIKDVTSLRESQQHIVHLAYYDDLTDLPNRVLLTERLQQAMLRMRRNGGVLVVCSLDVDNFKPINDAYGQAFGDQLLVEIAGRLKRSLREEDTVARLGGDEFVLLLGAAEGEAQPNGALERIRTSLNDPFVIGAVSCNITASYGATAFPKDSAADADTMLRHADQAMHGAKNSGKNAIHWFDPEKDRLHTANRIQYERLAQALVNEEFVLYFQPKVDLHSDCVEGVEALIRWMHPEEGLLPPSRFLPIIENTDLCIPLGEWVIREALRHHKCWQDAGLTLKICVNIFPHHLQQADFAKRLALILQDFPYLPPGCLNLEVLETSLIKDLTDISRRIRECNALGVDFSLDDFGTGYSSLSYFSRLPVKVVKIDQSFTRGILSSRADLALVQSIVSLSHSIGRVVVAEGVETIEHGLPLISCGCDIAQGYGIARPMAADEIIPWARNWRRPVAWLRKP